MASTNLILAVPTANSSVNYDLPANDSAKLSFSPEDIDGLKLDANGGLVISFVEGGNVTLNNFQSFIDNGNTLTLSDGTEVDPKLLFNAVGGKENMSADAADIIKIGIPAENSQQEINLESGKKYLFNFDLSETQGADIKDGKMIISFANGGKIVVNNYETAMAGEVPPELSLAAKTCIVSGDELITNIQALAKSGVVEETIVVVEEEADAKAKSKIADADMEGKEDIGPGDQTKLGYKAGEQKGEEVANIEPAAGEDDAVAARLAAIETAAGGPAGGARNSGYGYGSRPGADPFTTNPDIGPIDPTQLGYRAPLLDPSRFLDRDEDSNPFAGNPNTEFLDETNLSGGPISVSDQIKINFGADGNGGITANNEFVSSGSKTGNVLSSNGVPVIVTVSGNGYVGMAGNVKVFEITLDKMTGNYTFTQFEQLDHADGNDDNDTISLKFGFTARDGDGDAVKTSVTVVIADDAPTIQGDEKTIDETNLGPITVGGTLDHSFGEDGQGAINTAGGFTASGSVDNGTLTSSGVAVVVTSTATGYVGMAGGEKVFEVILNPSTGAWNYTQYKNLDHADNNDPNDIITLTFPVKIVDYDGDSDVAPIVINIKDDAPTVEPPCGCGEDDGKDFTNAERTVDETNLNGVVSQSGTLVANFGADTPGSYSFKAGDFQSGGSLKGNALTHNGVPVVVSIINGVYTGMAGNVKVFTLELNATTGDYKFTLLDNLDHADATNPDDVITLDFGVLASDYEGDSIEGNIRINVKDDAPVANNDVNTYDTTFGTATGNVVTGLNGGPGAADQLSTDGWEAGSNANKVVKIAFGGNEVDVPETGTVSIDGEFGTLTIASDGTYSYTAFDTNNGGGNGSGTTEQKTFVTGPALPDFDEKEALDGVEQQSLGIAQGNLGVQAGDVVSVNFVSEQAGYSNSLGVFTIDANGNLKAETMLITNANNAANNTFSYTAGSNASSIGFFIVADGNTVNNGYAGIDFSKGSLDFVYNYGQAGSREAKASDNGENITLVFTAENGTKTVISGPMYFTSDRGSMDNLNVNDETRVVSGVPNGDNTTLRVGFEDLPKLGDKDYNDVIIDVRITTGGKDDCGCGDKDIRDEFTYTLQDGDGDRDTATLTLNGKDLTDDKPIIATPAVEIVDETSLAGGTITETGKVNANFGTDGPGTISGNNIFTSGGSKLGGNLTSGGVAVVVTYANGTYTAKAGNTTVFTMQINADGNYTFKQFKPLDHADGNDANDIITLNFGVSATDCDGDVTKTTVVVKVKDDAPDAKDDSKIVNESGTVTGNVTSNDIVGQDTPGTVTKVVFNGVTYLVPASGTVNVPGQFGTLTIDKTGVFSYKANSNNPDGQDNFTYTLKDSDGDTDTATLCIEVNPIDDCPIIVKPVAETVDETNLASGTITETGTVTANFGSDGPGTFSGNNSFTSTGSKLGGNLTHNGTPVNVTYANGVYTGTAGGTTVFTMTINSNGSYEFKLYEQLDHADGSNPNDIITLNFGVTATDSDGDSDSTTIVVNVKDDAPVANDDSRTAEEGQTITGNVTTNDSPGQDLPASVTQVVFNGQTFPVPTTGQVTIVGSYGTLKIGANGAYSYTANSNNPDGTDKFTYTLRDRDGDTDPADLTISVSPDDDCPIIVKPADEKVDETNLVSGTITETGSVTANFGSDGPGSFAGNNSFTSGGSRTNNTLSHNGTPVVVSYANGTYTGVAGNVTIFTMKINTNGSYEFKLYEQLDHADGNNPNDIINLNFGVRATDADGDHADTTVTVKVLDDAPVANDDHNTSTTSPATGNVITGLNGGPGAADVLSQDVTNKVTKVSFGGTTVDVPATGTATIEGANGTLKIAADGSYTYTAKDGANSSGDEKTFVGGPALPDFNESQALDGVEQQSLGIAQGNLSVNAGDVISIKFVGEQAGYSNTLGVFTVGADGKLKAETILIKNSDQPGAGSASYTVANGGVAAGFFIVADGASLNNNYNGLDFSKGSLDFVYNYGKSGAREATITDNGANVTLVFTAENGTKTVIQGPTYFTSDRGDYSSLNPVGETRVVSGLPDQNDNTTLRIGFEDLPKLGDKDYNDMVFDISITNKDCGCNNADVFTYTLQDKDGDIDTATLTLDCVVAPDDQPILVKPADETIDETALSSGTITETGKVTGNFGNDGPGTFSGNNSFTSGGSRLADKLTSNGVAVVVTYANGVYTGKAGNTTVFTMEIKSSGDYTFKLFEQLDHKDGTNANDIITLDFGVTGTDTDGDKASTTVRVNVKDDAPDAKDDGRFTDAGQTITGNVTSNDVVGQDTPGKVTKVVFGTTTYDVPATGQLTVNGAHGTLKIDSTGAYTYVSKASGNGVDNFKYTLVDYDGDSDTAVLCIDVKCAPAPDDQPIIVKPADEIVDETNLKNGTITETGTVTANFGNDGPGTFAGNNSFTSGGSRLNNALTSNGAPVAVAFANGTYTGTAGGKTIFTMKINANGSYEFKLFEQLDHADGSNPNDIIDLTFGVKATDADGDSANTTVTVKVKDDAPIANDDSRSTDAGQTITGNVTNNDVVGQDTPGKVTKVVYGTTTYDVPTTGQVTINAANGTLKIDSTGAYTYVSKASGNGVDNFTYTLRDHDGDTDPAVLCIDVKCAPAPDDQPIIVKPADEIVDETNLKNGTITEGGSVTANFGNDGPGTFAGNNSFTSGGSRLNNALTHNGTPVVVTFANGTYTGVAGNITVFTMKINSNGSYEFKLFEQLDHADGSNPNDIIDLHFGVTAKDADGDTASTTVTVKVKDDAPIANDDSRHADAGQTITGNVTSNDQVGQDVVGTVSKIVYNGQTYNLTSSNTVINAANGTLTINNTGAYTYVAKNSGNGIDNFTYTLKDRDGDTDPAVLCIDVKCAPVPDDKPVPKDDNCTVQICGTRQVTSNVLTNDNFGNDGPGKVYSVTYNSKEYVLASTGTTTINTSFGVLMIAASGAYTYKLNANTDHTGIDTFKVTVKDADGDAATSNLNINVLNDPLNGGAGNDALDGTAYADIMNGNGGHDVIYAHNGNDTVHGNDGNDFLDGGYGNDTLYGDAGNDELVGRQGDDTLYGGAGNDMMFGDGASTDTYSGNDKLYGEAGDDTMYGRRGDDLLDGGADNDKLYGNEGNDKLIGGAGNDHLYGGAGNDILTGGTGADTFWFTAVNEGVDRIKDFNVGEGDKLELSQVVTNFDPVTDAINDFVFATYTGGNTIISVNNAGTGAAGATQIAVLENVNVNISDLFNNGNIIA